MIQGICSISGSGCENNDINNGNIMMTMIVETTSIALGGGVLEDHLYAIRLLNFQKQEEHPSWLLSNFQIVILWISGPRRMISVE